MSCTGFFRDAFAEDRPLIRSGLFNSYLPDWAMTDHDVQPGGWRLLLTKSSSIDFRIGGGYIPTYCPSEWNGVGHRALMSEGKVSQPFYITAADGQTWLVDEVIQDWWARVLIHVQFYGVCDYRTAV
jgi:hypothetical protein